MIPDLQEGAEVPVELVQGVPAAPAVQESCAEKMSGRLRDRLSNQKRTVFWCRVDNRLGMQRLGQLGPGQLLGTMNLTKGNLSNLSDNSLESLN